MGYETLLVDGIDSKIVTVTLNRPEQLNALTTRMTDELRELAGELHAKKPRAVVLTGSGRGFCAGADLVDTPFLSTNDPHAFLLESMGSHFNPMVEALTTLPCPLVVAVNGVAAGGGASLALLGDIVVAARSSYFVQVFAPKLGLVPDLGSTWTLPRLVGPARARGLALLGDRLDAETAAAWGLVWKTVDDAELLPTATAIAQKLADGPTHAFVATSRAMDRAYDRTLPEAIEHERQTQAKMAMHADFAEAITAFREKRAPNFGK